MGGTGVEPATSRVWSEGSSAELTAQKNRSLPNGILAVQQPQMVPIPWKIKAFWRYSISSDKKSVSNFINADLD